MPSWGSGMDQKLFKRKKNGNQMKKVGNSEKTSIYIGIFSLPRIELL
jgi:hypothetical protein